MTANTTGTDGDADAPFVLVVGSTRTAAIEGISAAGADPDRRWHTPAADAELIRHGRLVEAPVVPVSPTGCPTPALVTRAARDRLDFPVEVVAAGLAVETPASTASIDVDPGRDVRESAAVPEAGEIAERAGDLAADLGAGKVWIGESIPSGTTTALGVLRALGEPYGVSSSLPENPLERKRVIVEEGLAVSDLRAGDLAGRPRAALRRMGDPVLAAVYGLARGALDRGADVTLAGGTQMIAVGALLRHAGVADAIEVATTAYVTADDGADLWAAAADLDLATVVTDPGFDRVEHPALGRYAAGEAKEGAGMGGALARATRRGELDGVRERAVALYEEVLGDGP